jgi:hypothetical protein
MSVVGGVVDTVVVAACVPLMVNGSVVIAATANPIFRLFIFMNIINISFKVKVHFKG